MGPVCLYTWSCHAQFPVQNPSAAFQPHLTFAFCSEWIKNWRTGQVHNLYSLPIFKTSLFLTYKGANSYFRTVNSTVFAVFSWDYRCSIIYFVWLSFHNTNSSRFLSEQISSVLSHLHRIPPNWKIVKHTDAQFLNWVVIGIFILRITYSIFLSC